MREETGRDSGRTTSRRGHKGVTSLFFYNSCKLATLKSCEESLCLRDERKYSSRGTLIYAQVPHKATFKMCYRTRAVLQMFIIVFIGACGPRTEELK